MSVLFGKEKDDVYCLDFNSDGTIDFSTCSYQISSWGCGSLNREETKKLYEAMQSYFEKEK